MVSAAAVVCPITTVAGDKSGYGGSATSQPVAVSSEVGLIPQVEEYSAGVSFPCFLGAVPGGLAQRLLLQPFLCFCRDLIPFIYHLSIYHLAVPRRL